MEQKMNDFESLAQKAYARFGELAKRYYYKFKRPVVTSGGVPCMLFLGNHSSGKSSMINWLLGGDVQDVGLAPTDDGFPVIVYGETEEEVCGPAALARLPEEFDGLKLFGADFLQRLRVKVRNRELLRSVTLIDSPGMIDSAAGTVNRSYDFEGVVRHLAALCDMVFFLLDPDKPGTTGESVTVFSRCLSGVEFKLRVLLNKCDAFSSLYDFARTYGTVCWNLARVLHTKDLPKIWTVYSGETRETADGGVDLTDFNRHRDEFLAVVHDAAARRRDNVFSQALSDFLGLSIRMCVVNHASRRLCAFRIAVLSFCAVISLTAGALTWQALLSRFGSGSVTAAIAGVAAACLGLAATWPLARLAVYLQRQRLSGTVDATFDAEYRSSLAVGTSDNLHQAWHAIREETAQVIREAPLRLPFFGEFRRRQLDSAAAKVFASFQKGV